MLDLYGTGSNLYSTTDPTQETGPIDKIMQVISVPSRRHELDPTIYPQMRDISIYLSVLKNIHQIIKWDIDDLLNRGKEWRSIT